MPSLPIDEVLCAFCSDGGSAKSKPWSARGERSRRDAATFSACKLASDRPNCALFDAMFASDFRDDVCVAARCSGSIVSDAVGFGVEAAYC
jgi:hypothetical protein